MATVRRDQLRELLDTILAALDDELDGGNRRVECRVLGLAGLVEALHADQLIAIGLVEVRDDARVATRTISAMVTCGIRFAEPIPGSRRTETPGDSRVAFVGAHHRATNGSRVPSHDPQE